MKKLLILFIAVTLTSCGIKHVSTPIQPVSETFNSEGSKEDLFIESMSWMAENFSDIRSVIQFHDKEEGLLIGKYLLSPTFLGSKNTQSGGNYAVIRIQVKDGASKITIIPQDFLEVHASAVQNENIYGGSDRSASYTKERAIEEIQYLITGYRDYINSTDLKF